MLYLYRFFCGILELEFWGVYPEKILNLCAKNKITVWNTRFLKQRIILNITVKDFKKLPKLLKKSGVKLHILSKKGFPFFINKYKKRFGIFAGLIVFFAVLQFMSSFIWTIDIVGNKNVTKSEIISICADLGIRIGAKSSDIDTKNTVQDLLLRADKLSWASFNIEGCKLTVNVTEIIPKTEDNATPTNLKAKTDGIIKKIDVTSGDCVVSVGDTVKKGDLLVSGIIENMNETKFVHSIGSILAQTEEEFLLEEPFIKEIEYPTGRMKKRRVLEIFTLKIPLYVGREKGDFITEKESEALKLFSQNIPIKLHTKKFIFIKNKSQIRDYQKLCELLEERLLLESQKQNFTVKSKEFIKKQNSVVLSAVISKLEEITYSENLIFTIGK